MTVRAVRHDGTQRRVAIENISCTVRCTVRQYRLPWHTRYDLPFWRRLLSEKMPLEYRTPGYGLIQPNCSAIVRIGTTRSLTHSRQRKETRIVRDVRGHFGEPVRVYRHRRRVVKTGGLVTLLPARPLGPSLKIRPDRRRADVFNGTRRLRYSTQTKLDHVQRPVKHRGHVRIRHIRPVAADEIVVKVGE